MINSEIEISFSHIIHTISLYTSI